MYTFRVYVHILIPMYLCMLCVLGNYEYIVCMYAQPCDLCCLEVFDDIFSQSVTLSYSLQSMFSALPWIYLIYDVSTREIF